MVVEVPGPIPIIAILFIRPIGEPVLSPMGFALSSTVVHNAMSAPLSIPVFDAMEDTLSFTVTKTAKSHETNQEIVTAVNSLWPRKMPTPIKVNRLAL